MSHMAAQPASKPEQDRARAEAIERYFAAIRSGDYGALRKVLTPDAVTRWPQSGERIVGAASCVKVYENYPDGSPTVHLQRVTGEGATWVAESTADYSDGRWHVVSVFEFDGARNRRHHRLLRAQPACARVASAMGPGRAPARHGRPGCGQGSMTWRTHEIPAMLRAAVLLA